MEKNVQTCTIKKDIQQSIEMGEEGRAPPFFLQRDFLNAKRMPKSIKLNVSHNSKVSLKARSFLKSWIRQHIIQDLQ